MSLLDNLTPRRRWGVGAMASGILVLILGIVAYTTLEDPDWLNAALPIVVSILELLGFVIVLPGKTPKEERQIAAKARGPPG